MEKCNNCKVPNLIKKNIENYIDVCEFVKDGNVNHGYNCVHYQEKTNKYKKKVFVLDKNYDEISIDVSYIKKEKYRKTKRRDFVTFKNVTKGQKILIKLK